MQQPGAFGPNAGRRRCRQRRGLTLVELILATALSAMVLVAIFTAMEVQLRTFERATRRTERDRLAHVLLRRMATDLRGALNPATPGSNEAAGVAGLDSDDDESLDLFEQAIDNGVPWGLDDMASGPIGLSGDADRLRIDVVRAVPADGAASLGAFWSDSAPSPAESGIRTVEYFVAPHDESFVGADPELPGGTTGGLVRREMSEPVALRATQLGMLDDSNPAVPPLAPEVLAVGFRYHDGEDWLDAWDSTASGKLPRAVEITLLFASDDMSSSDVATLPLGLGLSTVDAGMDLPRYRLVVHIRVESPDTSATASGGEGGQTDGEFGIFDPGWEDEL